MPFIDPWLYIAGCAGAFLFQVAYSWRAAATLPTGRKVPMQWGLFGQPDQLASPWFAFFRAPLWAALMYGGLIAPLFFWEMPDVAPWYIAMTAGLAVLGNITHGFYIFFACRHVNRELEESTFQKTMRNALRNHEG